jgi:hypothetical protein
VRVESGLIENIQAFDSMLGECLTSPKGWKQDKYINVIGEISYIAYRKAKQEVGLVNNLEQGEFWIFSKNKKPLESFLAMFPELTNLKIEKDSKVYFFD